MKSRSVAKGLTLLELLVSLAVLLIVIGVGFDIFNSILKSNNKATVTNEVRQSGQLAMAVIERLVRNAESSGGVFAFRQRHLWIRSIDNEVTEVACVIPLSGPDNGVIYIVTSDGAVKITNDDKISGIHVKNCIMKVDISSQPPVVNVEFTFEQSRFAPSRKDFIASVTLKGSFSPRSVTVR